MTNQTTTHNEVPQTRHYAKAASVFAVICVTTIIGSLFFPWHSETVVTDKLESNPYFRGRTENANMITPISKTGFFVGILVIINLLPYVVFVNRQKKYSALFAIAPLLLSGAFVAFDISNEAVYQNFKPSYIPDNATWGYAVVAKSGTTEAAPYVCFVASCIALYVGLRSRTHTDRKQVCKPMDDNSNEKCHINQ